MISAVETGTPRERTIRNRVTIRDNGWGGIYGFAFLGALVYYIQHASTFWEGVIGIFKAIFWPGMLLYRLMEYLNM